MHAQTTKKNLSRKLRAARIVSYLKKTYPRPESELLYETPFQFVVAVILSAQCTDKAVNKATRRLFSEYSSPKDFARLSQTALQRKINMIPFYRNKAKAIIRAAKDIEAKHGGNVPDSESALVSLHGVGYKTAHVILGELYDTWDGIPTDTHVKRFARKFDLTTHRDLKKISRDLESLIPKRDWRFVNNGLVLYGRYVCKANRHDCREHPLTKIWPKAAHRWPKTS